MRENQETPPKKYFLYAEDDPDDQDAFREMMLEIDPELVVIMTENGLELIQYLASIKPDESYPCCIILDMNMPVWDGIRTLRTLKEDRDYKNIPVLMFTTSNTKRDAELSLQLGAEAFITKPIRQREFKEVSHRFAAYCGHTAKKKSLPGQG
jgi:CheY-like chemotaxis protein